jgi:hypothetical protein
MQQAVAHSTSLLCLNQAAGEIEVDVWGHQDVEVLHGEILLDASEPAGLHPIPTDRAIGMFFGHLHRDNPCSIGNAAAASCADILIHA